MSEAIIQVSVRVLASVLLLFVMGFCGIQLVRLWFDHTPILAPFEYTVDGATKADSGQSFARLLAEDVTVVQGLFSGAGDAESLVPSSHQLGLGHRVDFPSIQKSVWQDVQLEAYGVKFSALFQAAFGWMRSPNQISGHVSETGKRFTVHAALRNGHRSTSGRRWYLPEVASREEASFALACRLFRNAAAKALPVLAQATDEDFHAFAAALRDYDLYRARLFEAKHAEAAETLKRCAGRLDALLERNTGFALAWKLGGYVARENSDLVRAKRRFQRYDELSDEEDQRIRAVIAELDEAISRSVPAAMAAPETAPAGTVVKPGLVLGFASRRGATEAAPLSTVCCVAKDAGGKLFAIGASFALAGHPGDVVFVKADHAAAETIGIGRLPQDVATEGPRPLDIPAIIAVPLDDGVQATNELPFADEPKRIRGFAVPQPGEALLVVGFGRRTEKAETLASFTDSDLASFAIQSSAPVASRSPSGFVSITAVSKPGDAGGPVLTPDGRLVGMIAASDGKVTRVVPLERLLAQRGLVLAE
jgi:hypothetical protein